MNFSSCLVGRSLTVVQANLQWKKRTCEQRWHFANHKRQATEASESTWSTEVPSKGLTGWGFNKRDVLFRSWNLSLDVAYYRTLDDCKSVIWHLDLDVAVLICWYVLSEFVALICIMTCWVIYYCFLLNVQKKTLNNFVILSLLGCCRTGAEMPAHFQVQCPSFTLFCVSTCFLVLAYIENYKNVIINLWSTSHD